MEERKLIYAKQSYDILSLLDKAKKQSKEVIFLCVGNGKIWQDSFGAMMGSLLKELNLAYYVYGNISSSITSKNLQEYIDMIYRFHPDPYIIVFDSAISSFSGICAKEGATNCGALSNFEEIGDLSITFNLTSEDMKNLSTFSTMVREVKRIARFILFVFENRVEKICKSYTNRLLKHT